MKAENQNLRQELSSSPVKRGIEYASVPATKILENGNIASENSKFSEQPGTPAKNMGTESDSNFKKTPIDRQHENVDALIDCVMKDGYAQVVPKAEDWLKPSAILEAFEARAFRMVVSSAQSLRNFPKPEEGFAELSADLAEVAIAHCQLIVVSKFIDKLKQEIPGKGVKQQLKTLCNIYALSLLHKHQGEFLATSSITAEQASLATTQLRNLYSQVRPNAVALVDSFNYTDHYLGSILGRYDGNVYPKLYDAAWKDPLNDSVVTDGYGEYIKPLLKGKLHLSRL